jgi:RimJ/RimL family protein N-acetyltransferase
MSESIDDENIGRNRRDEMLKLVSKGFYKELVNYGVKSEEIIRVASHLLDNLINQQAKRGPKGGDYYDPLFTIEDVKDEWGQRKQIAVQDVCLRPLDASLMGRVKEWLRKPEVRDLFVPPFPESEAELHAQLLDSPNTFYFGVHRQGIPVGIVGGENIDARNGKLEMKKLVGDAEVRGRGVGKRATFAFLYYAFRVLEMHKVYIHSRDINIRNINLNSKFGFILEGIFLEDLKVGERCQDVVRMALFNSFWTEIFSSNDRQE